MPYPAMLDRLRNVLRQPTAAFVLCGYSFRDGHINDTIVQGLQYTRTSIVYALLFDDMQEYPQAEEIANRHPNLNVLARDGGIVGGRGSSGRGRSLGRVPGIQLWASGGTPAMKTVRIAANETNAYWVILVHSRSSSTACVGARRTQPCRNRIMGLNVACAAAVLAES